METTVSSPYNGTAVDGQQQPSQIHPSTYQLVEGAAAGTATTPTVRPYIAVDPQRLQPQQQQQQQHQQHQQPTEPQLPQQHQQQQQQQHPHLQQPQSPRGYDMKDKSLSLPAGDQSGVISHSSSRKASGGWDPFLPRPFHVYSPEQQRQEQQSASLLHLGLLGGAGERSAAAALTDMHHVCGWGSNATSPAISPRASPGRGWGAVGRWWWDALALC